MIHCGKTFTPSRPYLINVKHIGRRMILFEDLRLTLDKDGRSEGPKCFAVFYPRVQNVLHSRKPWMCEDRSIAKSARSPFHPALKPADDFTVHYVIYSCVEQLVAIHLAIRHTSTVELLPYLIVCKFITQV